VKPFTPLIPEVQVPETKVPFQQRIIWTSVTLVIFLVMSQMPLYGIVSSGKRWSGKGETEMVQRLTKSRFRHLRSAVLASYDDGK
jgi:preprotein translocase subunit SecY